MCSSDLSGFSTDRLFRFLNALGSDVEIRVVPRLRLESQAQTSGQLKIQRAFRLRAQKL